MKRFIQNWCCAVWVTGMVLLGSVPLGAQPIDQSEIAAVTNFTAATNSLNPATNSPAERVEEPASPRRRGPVVAIGNSAFLAAGDSADAMVAVGGSAKADGKVRDAVVAVGGDAEANADVGDAVVAVGGDATSRAKVGDAVVAIAGNAEAQGEVRDAVIAVMGNVTIGSNAVVRGDVVSVGGKVDVAEGAQIKGQIVEVSVARYPILAPLQGVADWLRNCALRFRLLAPQPGWYWVFVGAFLLVYLLIAVALPRPVAACVNELKQRPATTFLLGLLTKLLLPLVFVVLAVTGIGVVVIPFVLAAVFLGAMIGKVALFEYLGGQLLRGFGATVAPPVLALLTGFTLITLFYLVPFLSLLIYALLGLWAIGVAVTAAVSSARKETPPPTHTPTGLSTPGPTPPGAVGSAPMAATSAFAPTSATIGSATDIPTTTSPPAMAPVPEAFALRRAGFWERMGAAFLDVILIAVIVAFVAHSPFGRMFGPPLGLLIALAYFAGMWAWKSTTIGGVVLNLKVVRLDDQPVTFAVALVRGLASALSIIVFFLGFLWMLLDGDKQTWHDKIAGTVVVRSNRRMSLVCL